MSRYSLFQSPIFLHQSNHNRFIYHLWFYSELKRNEKYIFIFLPFSHLGEVGIKSFCLIFTSNAHHSPCNINLIPPRTFSNLQKFWRVPFLLLPQHFKAYVISDIMMGFIDFYLWYLAIQINNKHFIIMTIKKSFTQ